MAVKKSELYGSLWASCDALRGGMDSSQYKDYILTLLFVKYVSDKYKGVDYSEIEIPEGGSFDDMLALKGQKNIGEGIDKIIAKLAEANGLRGVIDNAHFNDESKLGSGKEMVDKLTELLSVFSDKMPDFSKNYADGDDIIGDAYEYLMQKFATESGKSKGQFYTPAEVSRILAHVIGIEKAKSGESTLYDPACGSGSLLIRAAEAAPRNVAVYGQEKDITTAGLAHMNLVLHNMATAEVKSGNTFSNPQYTNKIGESEVLKQFDFAVVNPPFSDKNWTHGLKEMKRFDGYGERPPQKNGDFAWLLHVIKSLKRNGKAAVILPHGVLFRGNAEAAIRRSLIEKGFIKGIIGLPPNLFYGTGIPACIIVIDKENAEKRNSIFVIDASRDFIKDNDKNRLRERDVYKITTVFNTQTELPQYSRVVPLDEIEKNDFNLNIPRYIQSNSSEDIQSIDAHLNGGIPSYDIENLSVYWETFPMLKNSVFKPLRRDFYSLAAEKDSLYNLIEDDKDFSHYADVIETAFENWKRKTKKELCHIGNDTKPKELIRQLAEILIKEYEAVHLIDKYDVYEVLLSYWNEMMSDDVYLIAQEGYAVIREIDVFTKTSKKKKKGGGEEIKKTEAGWDGRIIPKELVVELFFFKEKTAIDNIETVIAATQAELEELLDNAEEDSIINECLNDKKTLHKPVLKAKLAELQKTQENNDDYTLLASIQKKQMLVEEQTKLLKDLRLSLDEKVRKHYSMLSDTDCLKLLLDLKWFRSISNGIYELYEAVNHHITARINELAGRYENTLGEIDAEVKTLERKVSAHLRDMGFKGLE
ncbi:type I restriction-modification system subunit M [Treponema pedis]|uniref:site-specific DNA-methyltransferase (adenine-specific) n=1 Tax=Treponema pedis TaxID=409322 RepID=A0A7S6WPN7_9SPIR|nr:type I restriction-modification system subunit M [Treponema pedis]QOW61028.1 type I restriction-modification system subunit M [Treponema pedis]